MHSAVKHLHSELGHPANRSLARAIRLSGGSDEAVQLALHLKCEICDRRASPAPIVKAKLNEILEPFADIAIDLFELAGYIGFVAIFLNVVC